MNSKRGTGFWLGLILVGMVLLLVIVYVWDVNKELRAREEVFRLEREQNKQLYGSPPRRPNEQPSQGQGGGTRGR